MADKCGSPSGTCDLPVFMRISNGTATPFCAFHAVLNLVFVALKGSEQETETSWRMAYELMGKVAVQINEGKLGTQLWELVNWLDEHTKGGILMRPPTKD